MPKRLMFTFATLLLVAIVIVPAVQVMAIGEVTPTPAGQQPAQPTSTPLPPSNVTPIPLSPMATATPLGPAPGSVEALLDEALGALQAGDLNTALTNANQAIQMDPQADQAYAVRGIVYFRQGEFLRAVDDFTIAIDLVYWNWSYYTFRGDTYTELRQFDSARQDYDKAIEYNPRHLQAFIGRSVVYFQTGNNTAGTVDDLIARGLNSVNNNDLNSGIQFFGQAITAEQSQPTGASAAAFYNRALAYYLQGNLSSALNDYGQALAIMPRMHDSYLGRGIARRENNDIRGAGADFLERIRILENQSFNETISVGQSLDLDMSYGNVYRVTFQGQAGALVTIAARDADGVNVDPLLVLADAQGVALAGDDDFGGGLDSLIESFTLPNAGTYTIVVSHANGGFDGTVRLSLVCDNQVC